MNLLKTVSINAVTRSVPHVAGPSTRVGLPGIVALAVLICVAGCSRDPSVRKKSYFDSGNQYLQQGKLAEARIQFSNAIQIDPRFAEAHHRLAETYGQQRQWKQAYSSLNRTIDLEPTNAKARIELGNLLLVGHNLEAAREQAEAVLAFPEDSNRADAYALLANISAASTQLKEALDQMQKAIDLDPDRGQLHVSLALLQAADGDLVAAEQSLNRAVDIDKQSTTPRMAQAALYERQKRIADAEASLQAAIRIQPAEVGPRVQLARLFFGQGQQGKADEVIRQAMNDLKSQPDTYRLAADFYLSVGAEDFAIPEYASLVATHQNDLKLLKTYVPLLIARNGLDEAERLTDQILKKDASDLEGMLYQGELLNRRSKPAEAQVVLQAFLKLAPANPIAHYQLGLSMAGQKNFQEAKTAWHTALRLQPGYVPARRALGALAMQEGDITLAAQLADDIVRLQPGNPEGYLLRSAAQMSAGSYAAAERDTLKLVAMAPDSPMGYIRLGALRTVQQRDAEAASLFQQALARDPQSSDALTGLATLYSGANQPAKALSCIDEQISKAPNVSQFHYLRGTVLASMRDFGEASHAFQRAIEIDSSNVDAVLGLGQAYVSDGHPDRAIEVYETQMTRDPSDVRFAFMVGSLEEARGDSARAQKMYKIALHVNPNHALAANNLAYLMIEEKQNIDVALSFAQVARQALPDLPNTADTLGWAYYHMGAYGLAVDALEQAVAKAQTNPGYRYHLGLAYEKRNEPDKARVHLQKALDLDPTFKHADDIRRVLHSHPTQPRH